MNLFRFYQLHPNMTVTEANGQIPAGHYALTGKYPRDHKEKLRKSKCTERIL